MIVLTSTKNNVVAHPTIYLQNYNGTADSPLKLDTMGKELVGAGQFYKTVNNQALHWKLQWLTNINWENLVVIL